MLLLLLILLVIPTPCIGHCHCIMDKMVECTAPCSASHLARLRGCHLARTLIWNCIVCLPRTSVSGFWRIEGQICNDDDQVHRIFESENKYEKYRGSN